MAGLLFPADRLIRTVAPTFVAFQTQVSYESAMINNDILLIAVFSLLVYLLARGIRQGFGFQSAAVIGLVLGLGLLTKGSMLAAAPLIAFSIVLGEGIRRVRRWAALGVVTVVVAGFVSWPWYAFLERTYGNLSGLEQIKALQYSWTYRFSEDPSFFDLLLNRGLYGNDFALMRWRETWGEFGWRLIHLDGWLLTTIGVPLLVLAVAALAMLVRATIQRARRLDVPNLDRAQVLGLWLMFLVAIVCYGAMVQFGTDFALTQARYYFQAVGAVALILAYGLGSLMPRNWKPFASGAFLAFMIAVNLLIYTQYVIPYWYLAS
jgi:4-amino-4-deoxy-L-arabinose transferase-like glycosyltransferase